MYRGTGMYQFVLAFAKSTVSTTVPSVIHCTHNGSATYEYCDAQSVVA